MGDRLKNFPERAREFLESAAILALWVAIWTSNGDLVIVTGLCLLAITTAAFGAYTAREWTKTKRWSVFIVASLLSCADGGFVYWYNRPANLSVPLPNAEAGLERVFAQCGLASYIVTGPEGWASVLELQTNGLASAGLGQMGGTPNAKIDLGFREISKCEVKSYFSTPLFNVQIALRGEFSDAIPNANGTGSHSIGIQASRILPLVIPKVDPGNTFTFYVLNESNQFVSLALPAEVTFKPDAIGLRGVALVLSPGLAEMHFAPRPGTAPAPKAARKNPRGLSSD